MSNLSFMEKLMDGVQVEWKALEDLVSFRRGSFPQPYGNSEWYDGEGSMPFVQVVDVSDRGFSLKENTKQRISKLAQPKSVFVEKGTVIVTLQGTIGRVAITQYDCYVDRTLAIFTNYISGINKKYFAYQLKGKFDIEKENARGSTLKTITKEEFSKFEIPIPCPENPNKSLEIQAEIVRILDAFIAHTAELTAELTARKKQYNYYRDKLLSFEEGEVEWKTLEEIAEYSKTRISFEQLDKTNYVGVDNLLQNRAGKKDSGYLPTSGNSTEYREGDILIGNIRPYLKKIWQADRIGGTNGDVLVIRLKDETVNAQYLYQVLADEKFFEYNMQHAKGAKMPRGNKDKIMEYRFPMPKYPEDQAHIAFILDKFDALTNSIAEGLPREIELRQKQYEYYRDLLLSFPTSEQKEIANA
jgi:type I restriction enzyme S subunit